MTCMLLGRLAADAASGQPGRAAVHVACSKCHTQKQSRPVPAERRTTKAPPPNSHIDMLMWKVKSDIFVAA